VFRRTPAKATSADQARQRNHVGKAIIVLGALTWLLCLPRIGTLATVLFFAGPLVGSTVWPILAGLYWKRANHRAALWAMIAGSTLGLASYLMIGWYTGALVGTAVSMLIVTIGTALAPEPFDWDRIRNADSNSEAHA
jgi:Na+/proline symporter